MVTGETPKLTSNPTGAQNITKQMDPVVPVIQGCSDSKITINGKTHQFPTNKEYLLQEYAGCIPGNRNFARWTFQHSVESRVTHLGPVVQKPIDLIQD